MALGPGKYDEVCTLVREMTNARGAAVIVIGGDKGIGFSAQFNPVDLKILPAVLEDMAKAIRNGEEV